MSFIFWLVILVAGVLVEASTFSLVSIWFAVGALAAGIAALLGAPVGVQTLIFLAVSVILLVVTRPLLKKFMPGGYIPTNGELDIGKAAVVIERINAAAGTGRVRFDGVDWGARREDGSVIEEGNTVVIKAKGAAYVTVELVNN
ncbi:MAG: NfeD family protein [Ruminococcus sp.]|nr:NfeD family protein [Ruminococcus sp.]